ncbi:DNase I-like protein, partial [Trametes coccinea BRFM310]
MLQKTEIRVASLNINGFGTLARDHPENKWGRIYRLMCEHRVGVLMLQETHLTKERVYELHRIFADRIRIYHSEHGSNPTQKEGVAFVINKRIMSSKGAVLTEVVPGRAIQLALPWRGGETRHLLCVYAPTSEGASERRAFFTNLKQRYAESAGLVKPHLMGGDFNMTEDPIDRYPPAERSIDASAEAFDELKASLNMMLVDGWRKTHPTDKEYTFHRGSGDRAMMSRLDRIYVRPSMLRWMRGWKIERTGIRTDHSMVSVMMTTPTAPVTGKGRPTFPMHLLKSKPLAKRMKARGLAAAEEIQRIRSAGRTDTSNAQWVLQRLKRDWLEMARKAEKGATTRLVNEIQEREREVKNMGMNVDTPPEDLIKATESLGKLRGQRLQDKQAGSRLRHMVDGESPTKYWVRLHREVKPRELIPCLEKEGVILRSGEHEYETDPRRMADLAKAHFDGVQRDGPEVTTGDLREQDIAEVIGAIEMSLTGDQQTEMGEELSYDEAEKALKHAKNGTAPGLDGIQYEVWKTMHARFVEDARFEERSKFDVLAVITEAFVDVQRHGVAEGLSFTDGWICPIYKEKGELSNIANYRPITLLNTDYKLMTKALALRI